MFQCQSNYPKLFEILFRLHKKKIQITFFNDLQIVIISFKI